MSLLPRSPWRTLLQGEDRSSRLLVAAAAAQLIRSFVDGAIGQRPTPYLLTLAGAYLAIALAGQAATVAASYLGSRLAWSFTNRLRERLAEHTLRLDLSFHAGRTSGEMI